ncbi:MAG: hemolysin family protein [Candidatus Omnitrophica bacterium]|nr:hemolysin family protein [Candidatus Omnitrophota bacterium]
MKALLQSIIILFLLILTAVTSALEISIISMSRLRLRRLASEGSRRAAIILKILETPERFFSTILVSSSVVGTLIAVLMTAIVIRFMGEGGWEIVVSTAVVAFLIIVFEVTAKTIAANYSERMSLFFARPMRLLIRIFSPLVIGFEVIINAILKAIRAKTLSKASLVTDEEIRAMIKIGQEEGSLQKEKYSMITKVFALHEAVVKNVMTPKKDIFSISASSNIDDILNKVLESGYSRIPVYSGSPDNISGIINMKDLLMLSSNKDLVVLQDIVYPPTIVNESKKVVELLKEFQKGHTHIAIVVDSQDKVQGIVTLEDLVEEIIGEIEDEYDVRVNTYKTKHIK